MKGYKENLAFRASKCKVNPSETEQDEILKAFTELMRPVVADGGRKRTSGKKVHWTVDLGHTAALERHLARWDRGEKVDADSGAHPMVHAGFRCLAIAWQETNPAP
jgi:hypothetical protein